MLQNNLIDGLKKGFIDKEYKTSSNIVPKFLTNNPQHKKKVLSDILHELNNCDEFFFSSAFLTKSGAAVLINSFIELEKKGIKGRILVSKYQCFTQPEALKALTKLKNIELRIAENDNFHGKGYLFRKEDIYTLIIGSSNITADALCKNREWNIKVILSEKSSILEELMHEFEKTFFNGTIVDEKYIEAYSKEYERNRNISHKNNQDYSNVVLPNKMQQEALENLQALRDTGKNKALIISATATGKTYLSAFDVYNVCAERVLFLVHRENIARKAMESYKKIFGFRHRYGMFTGGKKEKEAEFIFATIQTMAKDEHLSLFEKDEFDYIIIDETHRAGAESYKKILDYFTPGFLLGMTATPERTDGFDIFRQFDYNVAYEIRLQKALEEEMLAPFHYYGISDIVKADGESCSDFRELIAEERVNHIIEKINVYGCDNGDIRGMVFCSNIDEAKTLSDMFTERGYRSIYLTGSDSEEARENSIRRLESNGEEKIKYIFSVDIFNEGVDIPRVNQIILLRPTKSVIVFVQQIGRGLRKAEGKEYLTILDFIGNYSNNYLIPIALYGDSSYNKDRLRRLITTGSNEVPGVSTVNFDAVSKEAVYRAINKANMHIKRDLADEYKIVRYKLGHRPMMADFLKYGGRDPYLFVKYDRAFFNFAEGMEPELRGAICDKGRRILEHYSIDVANGKRVEESYIMLELIKHGKCERHKLEMELLNKYGIIVTDEKYTSYLRNLNLVFATDKHEGKLVSVAYKYGLNIIEEHNREIELHYDMKELMGNSVFADYFTDLIICSIKRFDNDFKKELYYDGFVLYKKYSRKDVLRILNFPDNPVAQKVSGYIVSKDNRNCPIFITYHKNENISETVKYDNEFLSRDQIPWMSKGKRNFDSPDIKAIVNYREGLRMLLFIKKSDDEESEFYYMGDAAPLEDSFQEINIKDEYGKETSFIRAILKLEVPVEDLIYEYIIGNK